MSDTPKLSIEEAVPLPARLDENPYEKSVPEVYDLYGELRSCPAQYSSALGGFYWLTRYDDVRAAASDWERFSSGRKGVLLPGDPSAPRMPAIENDPPEHAAWRKLYTEALTPGRLRAIEPGLVAIANGLIDDFASAGECDLMRDFAEPLPVLGLCEAIGLSGPSVARIRELAYEITRSSRDTALRESLMMEMGALVLGELLARRADPRDDYLTRVAHAEIEGRPMDEPELARFMTGFLVAGHETTTSALGALLFHALRRPGLTDRMLTDDRVMAAAIEEAVRWSSPFHGFNRTTTEAVEIGGATIPEDATVRLCFASANRDPDAYQRPDEFDADRPSNRHLGFGHGRHVCLGAPFARLEMRTAFRELLRRLPDIRPVDIDIEMALVGGILAVPNACRVQFTPAHAA